LRSSPASFKMTIKWLAPWICTSWAQHGNSGNYTRVTI
jgi:hypothetical protein